ncbi:MAG TPA: amino acid-binding protein [Persephonella sp.]|uniref:Glycine cleavage system regulatory protein n=1 Tax=Persephonella marina (strain DSM 14350 / EX-H1) TaxID=123214 RepID=C0QT92_PERMH|nr:MULTISPECIES: ACT domain-containing protein [Persephonella]ACO03933.1 glycine cleavage system regulatory protein [Persephonella marina EX-H1]HCB70474.1 amino acid-binding protein [Persephonella sp.]
MRHFVLTAVGEDRPGIVAGITKVLYEKGFNIEDSTMTRLNNEFTVMLIVTTEEDITEDELRESFDKVAREKDLYINVKEIPEDIFEKKHKVGEVYNIVVYGADKPGIVYSVAKLLSDRNINISDLRTEKSNDLYLLIAQLEFPPGMSEEELKVDIERLKEELNIDISLEKEEAVEM